MKQIIAAVAIALSSSAAAYDGNKMYADFEDPARRSRAEYYIIGATDALWTFQDKLGIKCEAKATNRQVIDVVRIYVTGSPELRHHDAFVLTIWALSGPGLCTKIERQGGSRL